MKDFFDRISPISKNIYEAMYGKKPSGFWPDVEIFMLLASLTWSTLALAFLSPLILGKKYRTDGNYLSRRLADVQQLFDIARQVDHSVYSHPELEPLRDKLKYTHRLLTGHHENSDYNRLAPYLPDL